MPLGAFAAFGDSSAGQRFVCGNDPMQRVAGCVHFCCQMRAVFPRGDEHFDHNRLNSFAEFLQSFLQRDRRIPIGGNFKQIQADFDFLFVYGVPRYLWLGTVGQD